MITAVKSVMSNNITTKDKSLTIFIVVYFFFNAVNLLTHSFSYINDSVFVYTRIVMQSVLGMLLLNALCRCTFREVILFTCIELCALFLFIISLFNGVPFEYIRLEMFSLALVCIPLGVTVYFIDNKEYLYKKFLLVSYLIFPLLVVVFFSPSDKSYNMHFSYTLAFIILFHMSENMTKFSFYRFLLIITELLMLVGKGSRGALGVLFCFIVISKIISVKKNMKNVLCSIITFLLMVIIAVCVIEYNQEILCFLLEKNFNSRTLDLLLTGNFFEHDSGRLSLWLSAIDLIIEKPILGWGIGGYKYVTGFPYPHQIFFDVVLCFGLPIGMMLSVVLLILLCNVFLFENYALRQLRTIFVSIGFIPLLVSWTLITDYYFFIMLGLLITKKKRGLINEQ